MRLLVVRMEGDGESEAATRWAATQGWSARVSDERDPLPGLDSTDVVWIHGDRPPQLPGETAGSLQAWIERGGGLVLSLLAATAAPALGAPGPQPVAEGPLRWSHAGDPLWSEAFRSWPDYPHIRGLQGWGEHPLFRDLCRGTYTWRATEGECVTGAVFRKPDWPDGAARVIAVERAYVHLAADVAVAWEYDVGRGRVLCLGAHLRFAAPDESLHHQRDTIIRNALADAGANPADRFASTRSYWPLARRQHAPVSVLPRPRTLPALTGAPALFPSVRVSEPDASPFTLAGTRALVTGTEAGGVTEMWLHPLCVLGDLVPRADDGPLTCRDVSITAGDIRRVLTSVAGTMVTERLVVSAERSEVHYQLATSEASPDEAPVLELTFRLPLRLEWPYPVDALVPFRVELSGGLGRQVIAVTGRDGRHLSAVFVDGAGPAEIVADNDDGPVVRMSSTDPRGIRMMVTSSTAGPEALPTGGTIDDALREQHHRLAHLKQRTASVATGDPVVDTAWPWAVARLASFIGNCPYGRGVMAGYAASRPGWGRARPGYAWFFGRDTCWSVDAMLSIGMHDDARTAISLFVDTMDVTGKSAHEITTSGVVHYDAADATPLLLRAVASYAAWTGDRAQIQEWWPAMRRAVDFCVTCDRDGDGLPENSGVGHGWVESGPLGGGAVTSYVAAIWIDALRKLRPVAHAIGDEELARRLAALSDHAMRGFESLRDPASGRVGLHRTVDGRLATDLTALSAVPIALGVDTSPSADEILEVLASPPFSAPWGLRMLPTDDPRYDPVAYHAGTVWPLFTGWAALADARRGAADRCFTRIRSTAVLMAHRCKGAFDEVLHGDTGEAAGVCPDQAWSAAMVIAPVMTGLLGVAPDAIRAECRFHPRLPRALTRLAASGIRVGDVMLSVVCQRASSGEAIELEVLSSPESTGAITILAGNDRRPVDPGTRIRMSLGTVA